MGRGGSLAACGLGRRCAGCPGHRDLRRQTLEEVRRANPQVLGAAISATAPEGGGSRGGRRDRAGDSRSSGRSRRSRREQEWRYTACERGGDRSRFGLPLRDVSGDTVGALRLSYTYRAGGRSQPHSSATPRESRPPAPPHLARR